MDSRWPILASASLVALSNDFLYGQAAVVVQRLLGSAEACRNETDSCLHLTVFHFNTLFTVSQIFSATGAILAGYFADRLGTTKLVYIFSVFPPIGQLFVALSPYSKDHYQYTVIVLGQVFLGIADGAVITLAHRIKSSWFVNAEIGISFGIHTLMSRLGAACSYLVLGALVGPIGLKYCLWIGFVVAWVECISAVCMAYLDAKQEQLETWRANIPEPLTSEVHLALRSAKRLPASLWIIVAATFFSIGTVLTYTANAPNMLAERYNFSEKRASFVTGLVFDIAIFAPLIGWLTDRYGHRDYWLLGAGTFVFVGILAAYSAYIPSGFYSLFIGFGDISYNVAAYSSISIIAGHGSLGLAFGLTKLLDGLGTASCTASAGAILIATAKSGNHPWFSFLGFLTATSFIALALYISLIVINRFTGRHLSFTQLERSASRFEASMDDDMAVDSESVPLRNGFPTANYKALSIDEPLNSSVHY